MTVATYLILGFTAAILIPVLGAVIYYLGFWAVLTERIWSSYGPRTKAFMKCPACMGTWTAGIIAVGAWLAGIPFLFFPPLFQQAPHALYVPGLRWITPIVAALWGTFWIPILAEKHLRSLLSIPEVEEGSPAQDTTAAPGTEVTVEPDTEAVDPCKPGDLG